MSYRPMVYVQREWAGNGLRFATYQEAEQSARDLMGRWTLVEDYRVDDSDDPVNYALVDGRLVPVVKEVVACR
jgi:hypothetical protein